MYCNVKKITICHFSFMVSVHHISCIYKLLTGWPVKRSQCSPVQVCLYLCCWLVWLHSVGTRGGQHKNDGWWMNIYQNRRREQAEQYNRNNSAVATARTLGAPTRLQRAWRHWAPGEEETATVRGSIQLITEQYNRLIDQHIWFIVRVNDDATMTKWPERMLNVRLELSVRITSLTC